MGTNTLAYFVSQEEKKFFLVSPPSKVVLH
jgi:hypothetical protein